ncbi:MAG: hypothetical protein H7Z15_02445 [Rhizobacter sp.]|nr:hypothetical protein [Rhizobacter sp.]
MRLLLLLAAALVCTALQAQTVYRCGPDGREYSQTPCPQGRVVNVSDERSEAQRAAAKTQVREDQARGDNLERERQRRESVQPAMAGKINGRPAPPEPVTVATRASKKKTAKAKKPANGDFVAIASGKKAKSR